MKKPKEKAERYPEIEKSIIELLESKNRLSDFVTLQRLFPDADGRKFRVSMGFLAKDGRIKNGSLEEVEAIVQCKGTPVETSALSASIILVQE